MLYDQFAGNWIYRSFVNKSDLLPKLDKDNINEEDAKKWAEYMFGQGAMVFHPTVKGGLDGIFRMGTDADPLDMRLQGKIEQQDGRVRFSWNAKGLPDTLSDGWLYEYDGNYINTWPDGSRQVEAIVGSVIRNQPHNDLAPEQTTDKVARRGTVASFIMVRVPFKEAREVIPLPVQLLEMLASRHYRLHHCVWHGVRDNWGDPTKISEADKEEIRQLNWEPSRPNQLPTRGTTKNRELDNGAGEDFLYMHRQMIIEVRNLLNDNSLPPIEPWESIPTPNRDSDNRNGFSVFPAWDRQLGEADTKGLGMIKSDEYWYSRMSFLERKFKDPSYLATLTLDQFGAKIEWLIHNLMHIRWSSLPNDPESGSKLTGGRPEKDINNKWVVPFESNGKMIYYDDLNDTLSSHVHPIFWRLHGWVDDRINDWFDAHEAAHAGEVVSKEIDGISWFATGKWVAVENPWIGPISGHNHSNHNKHDGHGDQNHHDDHGDLNQEIKDMERVHQLIFNPDVFPSPLRPISRFHEKAALL
jgi:hypothetical protein